MRGVRDPFPLTYTQGQRDIYTPTQSYRKGIVNFLLVYTPRTNSVIFRSASVTFQRHSQRPNSYSNVIRVGILLFLLKSGTPSQFENDKIAHGRYIHLSLWVFCPALFTEYAKAFTRSRRIESLLFMNIATITP